MFAQTNSHVAGTYYLSGVSEMASGIILKADSTFEFFFSYGALDRYGSGKWMFENNNIVLNRKPYPGKDFKMTDRNTFQYGPICIDKKYRGKGLINPFFDFMRIHLLKRFPVSITLFAST